MEGVVGQSGKKFLQDCTTYGRARGYIWGWWGMNKRTTLARESTLEECSCSLRRRLPHHNMSCRTHPAERGDTTVKQIVHPRVVIFLFSRTNKKRNMPEKNPLTCFTITSMGTRQCVWLTIFDNIYSYSDCVNATVSCTYSPFVVLYAAFHLRYPSMVENNNNVVWAEVHDILLTSSVMLFGRDPPVWVWPLARPYSLARRSLVNFISCFSLPHMCCRRQTPLTPLLFPHDLAWTFFRYLNDEANGYIFSGDVADAPMSHFAKIKASLVDPPHHPAHLSFESWRKVYR